MGEQIRLTYNETLHYPRNAEVLESRKPAILRKMDELVAQLQRDLTAHDPRVHFGLGTDAELKEAPPESLTVMWPDGYNETWEVTQPDRVMRLAEGQGKVIK